MNITPIEILKPYKNNSKKHDSKQIKLVADSIKRFGFVQPIVIGKNNEVVIGHCRLEAAKLLDLKEVPTISVENLTEKEVIALRLADNKLNESEWDMNLAIEDLKGLDDDLLNLTGFDKDLLIEPDKKDDQIPENPPTVAQLGDIWALGRHRVMCGDSTKKEDVEKLMDGHKADMVFTSPPYNMGKDKMYESYKDNLTSSEYEKFLNNVIKICAESTKGIIFWNISYNNNNKKTYLRTLANLVEGTGLNFRELISWDKQWAMPISQGDSLTRQTEQIIMFESEAEHEIEFIVAMDNIKRPFFKKTQKKLSNYWSTKSGKRNLENHKACYPVELVTKAIIISTKEDELVYEPFCGSGTNVIACEKTNRICYGMEIDPKYCDVIIKRWEDYTGQKAKKLA